MFHALAGSAQEMAKVVTSVQPEVNLMLQQLAVNFVLSARIALKAYVFRVSQATSQIWREGQLDVCSVSGHTAMMARYVELATRVHTLSLLLLLATARCVPTYVSMHIVKTD